MDVDQERVYRIENISPALFQEGIRSLPVMPRHPVVTMAADGLSIFEYIGKHGKDGREKYLSECYKRGIIPFSRVKLDYSTIDNDFLLSEDGILYDSELQKPGVLDHIIRGGRINHIIFRGELKKFRENVLEKMLKGGYSLHEAYLGFTYEEDEDVGIEFRDRVGDRTYRLRMRLNEAVAEKDALSLKSWFTDLADKHSGQGRLFK